MILDALAMLRISERCPVCGGHASFFDEGTVVVSEVDQPGLEFDGDPARVIVYHRACAPKHVLEQR